MKQKARGYANVTVADKDVLIIVFLGMRIDHKILALLFTAIAGVLALLSFKRALALAEKK